MVDWFLNTPKEFNTLSLILEHLKYCLNTSEVETETIIFIKKLSNQLFANNYFAFITTFESIKHVNFSS